MSANKENKELIKGQVLCSDIANSRAMHRFVQKWVGRWVARKFPNAPRDHTFFEVKFDRAGAGHAVSCEIRLRLGSQVWSGANFGENLSEALERGLEHMLPATTTTVPLPA